MYRNSFQVLMVCAGLSVAFLPGCSDAESGCQVDADCRGARTCVDGVCMDADGQTNNGNNGAENNGATNNGTENNGTENNGAVNNGAGPAVCGNGVKEPGEVCDGDDLGSLTCEAIGTFGGELACVNCQLDKSGCTAGPPDEAAECGDGVKEPGEGCDGDDLGGLSCEDFGYAGGVLGCNSSCQLDVLKCESEAEVGCGNGVKDPGEVCDGDDFGGLTCQDIGFFGGELGCVGCQLDKGECTLPPPGEEPECGNGIKEPGEGCDGDDVGDLTCEDLGLAGELGCGQSCNLDLSGCYSVGEPGKGENCGNGRLDPFESCDGGVGDLTCESLGFASGELSCDPTYCFLDTSRCR